LTLGADHHCFVRVTRAITKTMLLKCLRILAKYSLVWRHFRNPLIVLSWLRPNFADRTVLWVSHRSHPTNAPSPYHQTSAHLILADDSNLSAHSSHGKKSFLLVLHEASTSIEPESVLMTYSENMLSERTNALFSSFFRRATIFATAIFRVTHFIKTKSFTLYTLLLTANSVLVTRAQRVDLELLTGDFLATRHPIRGFRISPPAFAGRCSAHRRGLCASTRTCESIAACHVKGIGIACEVEQAFVTISKTDRDRPKKFPLSAQE
jgi:hypothetical protein